MDKWETSWCWKGRFARDLPDGGLDFKVGACVTEKASEDCEEDNSKLGAYCPFNV